MPSVPVGLEAYQRLRGVGPEVVLKNYYLETDKSGGALDNVQRLQRPGLTQLVDFGAAVRGIFQLDGVLDGLTYVVAGDKLYSTDWDTSDEIGEVPDDGLPVAMAANALRLGFVTAGEFWVYDGDDLVQAALPDDEAPNDLANLNGYFILTLSNGRIRWLSPEFEDFSDPDAILAFATAEGQPDGLLAVRRLRDELFMFGVASIEVWQPTGDANSTFERAPGRTIDRGVQSRESVVAFDNSVVFVGDDGLVYRLTDVPERISTNGIEERISMRSDLCSAFTFTSEGHPFYCLTIPGQGTFAYDADTKVWSQFSTLNETTWLVTCATNTPDGSLAGDAAGIFYKIDPEATTDNGTAIERVVSGTIALPSQRFGNPHVSIWIGADEDAEVWLRWKDARDTDWSAARNLTARAGSDIVHAWRLGATRGPFRTFEITTTADTIVRVSGMMVNEGGAT